MILSIAALLGLEKSGILATRFSSFVSITNGIEVMIIIAITAGAIHLLSDSLIKSLLRARENEESLQIALAEKTLAEENLKKVLSSLEKLVESRTIEFKRAKLEAEQTNQKGRSSIDDFN